MIIVVTIVKNIVNKTKPTARATRAARTKVQEWMPRPTTATTTTTAMTTATATTLTEQQQLNKQQLDLFSCWPSSCRLCPFFVETFFVFVCDDFVMRFIIMGRITMAAGLWKEVRCATKQPL